MKTFLLSLATVLFFSSSAFSSSPCSENAKTVAPEMSPEVEKVYLEKLSEAETGLRKAPSSADAIIWLGRRTAYLGRYKEAIAIFSKGAEEFPKDARFLRHRGHRYITIRCFDDAIADLEKAALLVKGKPDEVEPDGLPNARNTPTSTLQSNIFYHLGLTYYLKGDYADALKAYEKCLKVSKNPDMFVATQNWHYLTLMRAGKKKEAARVLGSVKDGLDIIENDSYYKLLKLYADKARPETLLTEIRDSSDGLQNASMGYGIGTYFLLWGDKEKAFAIYKKILETDQWASFGYIAAESELKRVG
jgi:tetratricopeptide (TPR) repeat protein